MALLPQLLLSPPLLQTKRNGSSSRISASNLSNSLILADRATVAPLKTTTTLLLLLHTKEGFLYTKVRGAVKYSALFFV